MLRRAGNTDAVRRAQRRGGPYDVTFYSPWISSLLMPDAGHMPPGGAETQLGLLAPALASRGLRVALIAYPVPGLPPAVDGVDVLLRPRSFTRVRGAGKVLEVAAIFSTLLRLRSRVVVQRAAGFETGLVALATRARGARFVYSSASVVDFEFERLERRRRNAAMYELGVRLADEIVVQTEEQVTLCEQRFGRRPVVIKSLAEGAAMRPDPGHAFVWIGRLTEYKRPFEYLDLAAALPDAKFAMVTVPSGKAAEPLRREIERRAATLENLTVLGYRPRAELGALLDEAVAVVSTSEYEGMPNIFLEAWARGVPALALSHDPNQVIQREGLGAFADGSRTRFVELAREMWQERANQTRVAERCRAYISREHSAEAVAEQWVRALRLDAQAPAAGVRGSG